VINEDHNYLRHIHDFIAPHFATTPKRKAEFFRITADSGCCRRKNIEIIGEAVIKNLSPELKAAPA